MKLRTLSALFLCLVLIASAAHAQINTERYPVTTEPLTYTACMANNYISDPSQMPVFQQFTEITGVSFDWTVISSTNLETQVSLMLASNEIPDVSFGVFNDGNVLKYAPLGVFLHYEEYIDAGMPNLKYMATEVSPDLLKSLTFSDGHIYTLPKLGAPNVPTTTGVYINRAWLDELNLQMPATTDELYDVLTAFKAHAGEGSIPENCVPLAWSQSDKGWTTGQLNAWFGVTLGMMFKDGTAIYSPYTEEWKDMVLWLNKCWKNGLMDTELFTQDGATFKAKGRELLYGAMQTYTLQTVLDISAGQDENYSLLPALNDRAFRQRPDGSYTVLNKGVISAAVEKPELLMSALDLLYDSDMGFQIVYGPFDIVTEITDEGEYKRKDDIPPAGYSTLEEWTRTFSWNQLPCAIEYTDQMNSLLQDFDRLAQYEMAEVYGGHWINDVMIYGFQTIEESNEMSEYSTDIEKYVNERYAQWVTGERDVEADWEEYKTQLEKLHVREYTAAYQAYYDRLMK